MPLDEIAELEKAHGAAINEVKKRLADEATAMLHGAEEAKKARATAEAAFERGALSENLPTVELVWAGEDGSITQRRAEAIVATGLAISTSAAKRLIGEGGVRINGELPEVGKPYDREDVLTDLGAFKVAKKKQIVLVKPV